MKEIPLTKGYTAIVDDEDYERFGGFKWCASKGVADRTYYAVRATTGPHPTRKTIRLHRAILGAPAGTQVDHVNRDGLDNRRANLRLATRSQNRANSEKRIDGLASRFKGVCWERSRGRWMARIGVDGRKRHLGYFDDEEQAARAYDRAARAQWGEFARPNFPQEEKP